MSATSPCVPCCATPQTVNVPGVPGEDGGNGTNGLNAYTVTTQDFVIPALNATVSIFVGNALWLVIGQQVIIGQGTGGALAGPGPALFQVTAIASSGAFTGKFIDALTGGGTGTTISAGAVVSPSGGPQTLPLPIASGGTGAASVAAALTNLGLGYAPTTVYAAGTAYTVLNSQNAVDFGTTDPALVLAVAGTYLLLARLRLDFVGATFTGGEVFTGKLRRTNNTAADVSNATSSAVMPAVTTKTYTQFFIDLPPVVYTTANTNDAIAMYAGLDVSPGAGALKVTEASIVAVKLY